MVTSDLAYHVWFKSYASFNNKPNAYHIKFSQPFGPWDEGGGGDIKK